MTDTAQTGSHIAGCNGSRRIVFLEAITPWMGKLAAAVSKQAKTGILRHCDIRTRGSLHDLDIEDHALSFVRDRIFPPGFAGTFSPIFAPLIRSGVAKAVQINNEGERPVLVAFYPYSEPWIPKTNDIFKIYLNLDDYELYGQDTVEKTRAAENRLIERSDLTLCLSVFQQEKFQKRFPQFAEKIRHFPLGVETRYLNPDPRRPIKSKTIGYVGNLTDRVDWALVRDVASLCSDLNFEFIGRLTAANGAAWGQMRDAVTKLDNVSFPGPVPQEEVADIYWRSRVNWMPYDTEHGFNKASCPTKIFDALASGRPFVSTSVPEILAYPDWIKVADDPEILADALRKAMADWTPTYGAEQTDYASANSWAVRGQEFMDVLATA